MAKTVSTAALKEFVVDHLSIGVFSVDKQMNILLWNSFMENNTHKHADEVIGQNLFDLFPELPQKWLTRKFKSVFILKNFAFSSWRQRPYLFKFSHNRPITGGIDSMRQDLVLMPVKGSNGDVEAVNVALIDMTDVSIFQGMMAETMEQMETLDGIVKTINQETELDGLINTVIEQGLILFPQADNGICWLLNSTNQYQCAALVNSPLFISDDANIKFIDSLSSFVKTLNINKSQMNQLYTANADSPDEGIYHSYQCSNIQDSDLAKLTYQQSTLTIALISEDKIIGYLVFNNYYDDEAFANVDLKKLKRFREHTVSAISKAKFLKAIAEESDKIKNLLDNAGQGFLSFASDLKIEHEYSAECVEIFQFDIEGVSFPELIMPYDKEQQNFLNDILQDIFDSDGDNKLFMSLLPAETKIGDRNISIEYRPIKDSLRKKLKMLVILTDITQTRTLQSKVEQERNVLQMIVTAVTKRNDTIKAIREYQSFCFTDINEILTRDEPLEDIIFELFRHVHTFKGSFSQLDFVHLVPYIHEFENQLTDFRLRGDDIEHTDLIDLCAQTPMWQWMEQDLQLLKNALGDNFLEQEDTLNVEIAKVRAIEQNMLRTLSPVENQIFLPQLRQLKAKSFASLIEEYSEYMTRVAESLDKAILPMVITGDDVQVDPSQFSTFCKSLIHVFRNIVDHGIETIEDRIELGKEEFGVVRCHISYYDNLIVLRISDDGNGIDTDTLRMQMVDKGLMSEQQVEQLTEEQVINSIFDEQVSSKQQASELSGRGIGLSAVKQALNELGGNVKVKTELNVGTSFYFSLPFKNTLELPQVDTQKIVKAITQQTCQYLATEITAIEIEKDSDEPQMSEQLQLHHITTFIRLKGLLDGVMLFSFDQSLAQEVAKSMMICLEEDESDMLAETITEICNIILGNSMHHFSGINELVMMDVPLSLNTRTSLLENLSVDALITNITTTHGCVSVNFISS